FKTDIAMNFERRSVNYFFVRFSDETDGWFLTDVSVANRKKIAKYAYNMAASGEGTWPSIRDNPVGQETVDMLTDTVDMGPRPITEASLQAHTSEYLPWLYEVLGRLEQLTPIREPEPQQFASKGY